MAKHKAFLDARVLATSLLLCTFLVTCDDAERTLSRSIYSATLHTEDEVGTPTDVFAPGDPIVYVYDVVNQTDELREIYVNGCYFRVELHSEGRPWERVSQGCITAFWWVYFEPHERRTFSFETVAPLEDNAYTARAIMNCNVKLASCFDLITSSHGFEVRSN
jgi:hypothetical protein